MATLYRTNGDVEEVTPLDVSNGFSLEELQGFVDGWIEIVPLGADLLLVCNEEGKLNGLPMNAHATDIWERYFGPTDILVGDVLIGTHMEIQ